MTAAALTDLVLSLSGLVLTAGERKELQLAISVVVASERREAVKEVVRAIEAKGK